MRRLLLLSTLAIALTGCGVARNVGGALGVGSSSATRTVVEQDGVRYLARAKANTDDKREVTITVTPVAVSPETAVTVGDYQATRYCILTYGGSDKEWTVGPDTPLDQISVVDNTLTLRGRCTQR